MNTDDNARVPMRQSVGLGATRHIDGERWWIVFMNENQIQIIDSGFVNVLILSQLDELQCAVMRIPLKIFKYDPTPVIADAGLVQTQYAQPATNLANGGE